MINFIVGLIIGVFITPIIDEFKYIFNFNTWKKDLFSLEFIKNVFNNLIEHFK